MKKKTVKEVEMHKFLVCAYKSQDFDDRATVTFRNSACHLLCQCQTPGVKSKSLVVLMTNWIILSANSR